MAKWTQASIRKLAEDADCTLTMELSGNTWTIELDAPEGKSFNESGASCSSNIHGNGYQRGTVNWTECAESIKAIIDAGMYDDDEE